jgi:hypothetical protein
MGQFKDRGASQAVKMARQSGSAVKQDNHAAALGAKIEMRKNVLGEVKAARVFDAFCGTGVMYRAVWNKADHYVGCDVRPWEPTHPPRFVADNRRLMRNLDLSRFNVFDFDAYGTPWDQMEILLARRQWAKGEVGAVIVTDGSALSLRFGTEIGAVQRISGTVRSEASSGGAIRVINEAMQAWLRKSKVKATRMWRGSGSSRSGVIYTAVVFVGE